MKLQRIGITLLTIALLGGSLVAPLTVNAHSGPKGASQHRQETKNNWRNIAIGSGVVGLVGLLKHNNTLTFAGAAGTLYSLSRYEHDRKSQSKTDHARAQYFSKSYFKRDGHRYDRKIVTRHGKKYYQFVRR